LKLEGDEQIGVEIVKRAVEAPKSKRVKRAKLDKTSTSLTQSEGPPPSIPQTQKALRRYVENFYDIQEMRLAAGGRTAKKPRKDKNGNLIPEIELHIWDKERLLNTKDALQAAEDIALKDIEACLQRISFYNDVLVPQKAHFKGLGPTMAGVILSSFDIHRSDTVSKMWALAGLRPMPCYRCNVCQAIAGDNEDGTFTHPKIDKVKCATKQTRPDAILKRIDVYDSAMAQRAQKGVKLNFNKWLRTKLVGVLGPVILKMTTFHCPKCMDKVVNLKDADGKATEMYAHPARKEGDPRDVCELSAAPLEKSRLVRQDAPFRKFYDNYKNRKEQSGWGMSDGHRHNAAIRFMIKQLLLDIHTKWRTHEGLPVRPTYQEQYLGHKHHSEEVHQPAEDNHGNSVSCEQEETQTDTAFIEAALDEEVTLASR